MEQNMQQEIYLPETMSRRGELIAWVSSILMVIGWIVLVLRGFEVPFVVKFLTVFLILAGAGMSLSNWMDRRSILVIGQNEIHFENGLRNVTLLWNEIDKIEIFPSRWGEKVYVSGEKRRFNFRKFSSISIGGEVKGQMGFKDGDKILKTMLEKTGLSLKNSSGPEKTYARR